MAKKLGITLDNQISLNIDEIDEEIALENV